MVHVSPPPNQVSRPTTLKYPVYASCEVTSSKPENILCKPTETWMAFLFSIFRVKSAKYLYQYLNVSCKNNITFGNCEIKTKWSKGWASYSPQECFAYET